MTKADLPRARDFMNTDVHRISPELSVSEVIEFLLKHELSNAPVVSRQEDQDILIGFISEADCLSFLSNEVYFHSDDVKAWHLMKRHLQCPSPDADIFHVASMFAQSRHRHLPVVGENNEFLGLISRQDILQSLYDYYKKVSQEEHDARFPPDLSELINMRFIGRHTR